MLPTCVFEMQISPLGILKSSTLIQQPSVFEKCADQFYWGSQSALRTTLRPTFLAVWCLNEGSVVSWGHTLELWLSYVVEGSGRRSGNDLQTSALLLSILIFISKLPGPVRHAITVNQTNEKKWFCHFQNGKEAVVVNNEKWDQREPKD